ncbi:MAG: CHASE2 domain-containing protein [Verrucomicrobiia bacterium]
MKSDTLKILILILLFACLISLIHFYSKTSDSAENIVNRLELLTYDWRVRKARALIPAVEDKLGFVFISDESINAIADGSLGYQFGLYWPRAIYGLALRELTAEKAKAVAFDVLFANRRPDHPKIPLPEGGEAFSDEFFAEQIKQHNRVILAASQGVLPDELFRTNALMTASITGEKDHDGVLRRIRLIEEFKIVHPLLKYATKIETNRIIFTLQDDRQVSIPVDKDGCFKLSDLGEKPPPGATDKQKVYTTYKLWNLGIALAACELGLDLEHPEFTADGVILKGTNGISRKIPIDKNQSMFIDWSVTPTDKQLITEAIESLILKDRIRHQEDKEKIFPRWRNKLVIVGSIATGNDLTDLGATPLEKETYLVSTYWNVARSIINGKFIQKTSAFVDFVIIVMISVFSGWISWRLKPTTSFLLLVIVAIEYISCGVFLYATERIWIPIATPVLGGIFLNCAAIITYKSIFEEKEQRRIKGIFSKVVSPDVVNELLKSERLSLGGTRRKVTVLFADIRGFTEFTDRMHSYAELKIRSLNLNHLQAEEIYEVYSRKTLETVNLYLSTVANIVKKYNGTLDKYIGDCVMAFWGAPAQTEDHAVECVKAAIEAQKAIDELNKSREEQNKNLRQSGNADGEELPLLMLGTGINTGFVTVGLMGSEEHILNYTIFGREVNLASRLESVSGYGRIIISQSTYDELKEKAPDIAALCVKLDPVSVKGIKEPVNIYEVKWRMDKK